MIEKKDVKVNSNKAFGVFNGKVGKLESNHEGVVEVSLEGTGGTSYKLQLEERDIEEVVV